MKRRRFLSNAIAGTASTVSLNACRQETPAVSSSSQSPSVRWRMATSWSTSLDIMFGGAETICQRVSDMTDRIRYARKHLRVSRQRKEYAKRCAYCVIQSNDLVAYEDLNVKGMVRNRKLAKSIADVAWSTFRQWLEYFGYKYGKVTVAVPPHNTSQNCSNCGEKVQKSLSTRTHICPSCLYVEDRDVNAAINILRLGLSTTGHVGSQAWGEETSTSVGENLSEQVSSVNQESHGKGVSSPCGVSTME